MGCGGEHPGDVPVAGDARAISDLVEELNEARMDLKKATSLFAKQATPEKTAFKKYAPFSYWANVGKPIIDGDSATLKVAIRDEKTGDDAGQFDWSFVKEGEGWKIQSAPLP